PALARAWAPLPLGEVCSARGAGGGESRLPAEVFLLEHCAYCAPHAGSFAAPPPAGGVLVAPADVTAACAPAAVAPPAPPAWPAAQPRAPPPLTL
ncbi:MAG: DUF2946 family protein, partial [Sutterellaceae bacterium]|nr:DUF2946 family protein [Burkholderiaceae bacterium]MDW8430284.1 DUF2946 family protein [Sutterellaceae bacterium]